MNTTAAQRRVAVFRTDVLPLSETFIRDQARALTRWQPTLVGELRLADGLALDGIDVRAAQHDTGWGRFARRLDRAIERLLGHSIALTRLLRSVRPDLVHVHFATDAVGLWPTVERLGLPMVVTLHGYDINTHADWWRAGHSGQRMRSYPERLIAMAHSEKVHFMAVSEAIRRTALAFGLPPDRIRVKYIGVQTRRFAQELPRVSERAREVLFVGRLVEKKGLTYLLQAASALRERVPGLRLIVLGDGPLRAALEAEARQLGVHAEFLGAQPHGEVSARLRSARLLCLPSVTAANGDAEGIGTVLLEAQAAGVPVVSSARGGSEDGMVDRITGFAFAERDVAALARALEALMLDGALADAMSDRAAEFVREHFEIAHCTRAVEAYYDAIVTSGGATTI